MMFSSASIKLNKRHLKLVPNLIAINIISKFVSSTSYYPFEFINKNMYMYQTFRVPIPNAHKLPRPGRCRCGKTDRAARQIVQAASHWPVGPLTGSPMLHVDLNK